MELLETLLFLHAVNADAETGCGPFGDEPYLSLPGEKKAVARGKVSTDFRTA